MPLGSNPREMKAPVTTPPPNQLKESIRQVSYMPPTIALMMACIADVVLQCLHIDTLLYYYINIKLSTFKLT